MQSSEVQMHPCCLPSCITMLSIKKINLPVSSFSHLWQTIGMKQTGNKEWMIRGKENSKEKSSASNKWSYPGVSRHTFRWLRSISFHIWVIRFISWASNSNRSEQNKIQRYDYNYPKFVFDDVSTRGLGQEPHDAPPLNQPSQPDMLLQSPVFSVPAALSDAWRAVCVPADHTRNPHTYPKRANNSILLRGNS